MGPASSEHSWPSPAPARRPAASDSNRGDEDVVPNDATPAVGCSADPPGPALPPTRRGPSGDARRSRPVAGVGSGVRVRAAPVSADCGGVAVITLHARPCAAEALAHRQIRASSAAEACIRTSFPVSDRWASGRPWRKRERLPVVGLRMWTTSCGRSPVLTRVVQLQSPSVRDGVSGQQFLALRGSARTTLQAFVNSRPPSCCAPSRQSPGGGPVPRQVHGSPRQRSPGSRRCWPKPRPPPSPLKPRLPVPARAGECSLIQR